MQHLSQQQWKQILKTVPKYTKHCRNGREHSVESWFIYLCHLMDICCHYSKSNNTQCCNKPPDMPISWLVIFSFSIISKAPVQQSMCLSLSTCLSPSLFSKDTSESRHWTNFPAWCQRQSLAEGAVFRWDGNLRFWPSVVITGSLVLFETV